MSRAAVTALMVVVVVAAMAGQGQGQEQVCDAVVAEVEDLCRDYVVGKAPPSPGLNSPCCKALRRNRASLRCLCGRVDFAALNQKNAFLTSTICLIGPLECA